MDKESGTIDITNLVDGIKGVWVRWAVSLITNVPKTIPWLAWLSLPIISQLFEFFVSKMVTLIANALEMEGFFLNTAIRKASQASDFVDAINAKNALPKTASTQEYENAEKTEMAAFRNFVRVTN